MDTRVYDILEDTFLPMLPEKLHRTVNLFLDLLREVIDVLLAFKAFGQRPPDASALTQKKSFTPMALPQKKAIKNECICRCDCCDCCPCWLEIYLNVFAKVLHSSHNLTNPQFPNLEISLLCPQIQKNECIIMSLWLMALLKYMHCSPHSLTNTYTIS